MRNAPPPPMDPDLDYLMAHGIRIVCFDATLRPLYAPQQPTFMGKRLSALGQKRTSASSVIRHITCPVSKSGAGHPPWVASWRTCFLPRTASGRSPDAHIGKPPQWFKLRGFLVRDGSGDQRPCTLRANIGREAQGVPNPDRCRS